MKRILCLLVLTVMLFGSNVFAKDMSASELVIKAWEAAAAKDYENLLIVTNKCIEKFQNKAKEQQSSLTGYAPAGAEENYSELNNVAVSYFIQGEMYMEQEDWAKAKEVFQTVIDKYSYAQYWDQRGWFWKVAVKSKQSIDKINQRLKTKEIVNAALDKEEKKPDKPKRIIQETFELYNSGTEFPINYEKYGRFENRGKKGYKYVIEDEEGLIKAAGEGVYPNGVSVYRDPVYRQLEKEGVLEGNKWDFVNSRDNQLNFYKWASLYDETEGVKLFYIGYQLEKAGLLKQAIKAYYAILVHFPEAVGWTYWNSPWNIGQVAINKINYITKHHPELGVKLVGADIYVKNGYDNSVDNDIVIADPGRLVVIKREIPPISPFINGETNGFSALINKIKKWYHEKFNPYKKVIGGKKVKLVQYRKNDHWQLIVDDKPFMIKAVTYTPSKIGQSPDKGTLENWMQADYNNNGLIDGPYDAWVDKNRNNKKDADEKAIGDFALMKNMGVNAIRIYHHPDKINKKLLRELYEKYGIMSIIGDFIGMYAIGSGASWNPGTDYSNLEHRKNMIESVKSMVMEFKDEPYVLMWLLGNESNYGVASNAKKIPDVYYGFVDEAARIIKSIDSTRPVAICNGDTLFLDIFAKECPNIDIFGANSYRGKEGFGVGFWGSIKRECDKAAFITEYGCGAFAKGFSLEESENAQVQYHKGCWEDILYNSAGYEGFGNSIGGVVFEWVDEWWKAYEPSKHDTEGQFSGPFPDGFMHEEWLGICGQGDGTDSPYMRQIRPVYYTYQQMWKNTGNNN